jgi:hypothetical protein
VKPEASSQRTPEERAARKARRKGTPSHYRERLGRLKRRAEYLRTLLNTEGRSESSRHHMMAEISALEWAVETLTPWFAKDERDEATDPDCAGN